MRAIPFSVLFLSLLAACADPPEWRNDRFQVTGEFRADGTCTVAVDGRPVLGDTVRGLAKVRWDTASGGRNIGWHEWTIWCQHERYNDISLLITAKHPRHRPLTPATYPMLASDGEPAGPPFIGATLWEPETGSQGRRGAHLDAYDGALKVDRVEDTLLVGTFRFVARRIGNPPFQ
ncbi:MAG TPA: hypothetical protein VF746_17215 [Longimicrobium sp.]|jgi:hypothetical protein